MTADQPRHSRWLETSHQLLGLPTPPFPAADFIGHIIFWDKQTTRALTARIEAVTGVGWIEALCRTREFSEYMLYGYFVQNDPASVAAAHRGPGDALRQLLGRPDAQQERAERSCSGSADKNDVAFSIASFSGTPVDTIRAAIAESDAILAPAATAPNPRGSPRYADRASQHQPDRQYPLGAAGAVERVHFHAAVFAA